MSVLSVAVNASQGASVVMCIFVYVYVRVCMSVRVSMSVVC